MIIWKIIGLPLPPRLVRLWVMGIGCILKFEGGMHLPSFNFKFSYKITRYVTHSFCPGYSNLRDCQEVGALDERLGHDVIREAESHWGRIATWPLQDLVEVKPFLKFLRQPQWEEIPAGNCEKPALYSKSRIVTPLCNCPCRERIDTWSYMTNLF